jgi:hypothetical protein
MLGFDRECGGVFLRELVSFPEAVEQLKTELAPEGLLDDLAVAFAGARRTHLDGAQNFLFDGKRRTNFRHIRILAS